MDTLAQYETANFLIYRVLSKKCGSISNSQMRSISSSTLASSQDSTPQMHAFLFVCLRGWLKL
jgi:hypothetical protein